MHVQQMITFIDWNSPLPPKSQQQMCKTYSQIKLLLFVGWDKKKFLASKLQICIYTMYSLRIESKTIHFKHRLFVMEIEWAMHID